MTPSLVSVHWLHLLVHPKKYFFKESTYTTSYSSQAKGKQQAYNTDLCAESQNWNKSLSQFCHISKIIILIGRMLKESVKFQGNYKIEVRVCCSRWLVFSHTMTKMQYYKWCWFKSVIGCPNRNITWRYPDELYYLCAIAIKSASAICLPTFFTFCKLMFCEILSLR